MRNGVQININELKIHVGKEEKCELKDESKERATEEHYRG
jgi:hypothetical protein